MPRKKQPAAGMVYKPGSRCPNINEPKRWIRFRKSLRFATSEKPGAYIANGEKHYKNTPVFTFILNNGCLYTLQIEAFLSIRVQARRGACQYFFSFVFCL